MKMSDKSFRRSLAQDDVDCYNNTFGFILLLLLGFLSLLLPLTPALTNDMQLASMSSVEVESQRHQMPPKVSVKCWGPAQFQDLNHVRYMDTYCSEEMNGKINGIGEVRGIYQSVEVLPQPGGTDREFQKAKSSGDQIRPVDDETDKRMVDKHKQQQMNNEKVRKKLQYLVYYQAPLIFLLFALVFEVPYVLCSLIRNAMPSCINVDQILDACVVSRSLTFANQTQILKETAEMASESVKTSRNVASTLYLISKICNTVIVIVAVCYIGGVVLADVNSMKQDLKKEKPPREISPKENPYSDGKSSRSTSKYNFDYPNNVFHCFFRIRQKMNVHYYTVQCVVNKERKEVNSYHFVDNDARPETVVSSQMTQATKNSGAQNVLFIYQALFSVALAFLLFLLVANTISTIFWLRRLFSKAYASSVGLPSTAARDAILLMHMAWLNAGPTVARGLTGSFVRSSGLEETDREPIVEVETNDH